MKKSKLTETQIISMLNEAETGKPVADLCRDYKVSSATFYKLKSKYAGMSISELKRMKALEAENQRLKAMYADVSLEHKILKEIIEKKYPELIDDN